MTPPLSHPMAYLEVRRLAGMRSPWMMSTGPLQQIAVSDGPGYDAARNAASVAAREDGLVGLVAGVVVVYRLVEPDGDDQVGWLYDGSKAEALGLIELAKADILGFDPEE